MFITCRYFPYVADRFNFEILFEAEEVGYGGEDGHEDQLGGQREAAELLGLDGEDRVAEDEEGDAGAGDGQRDQVCVHNIFS